MSAPQNPAQAAIDADVAQIGNDFTTLAGIFTDLQTLVAEANGNGQPVSTAALDALVAQGASVLQSYQGLVTPTPAPSPTPAPVSTTGAGSSAEAIGAESKEAGKKHDEK